MISCKMFDTLLMNIILCFIRTRTRMNCGGNRWLLTKQANPNPDKFLNGVAVEWSQQPSGATCALIVLLFCAHGLLSLREQISPSSLKPIRKCELRAYCSGLIIRSGLPLLHPHVSFRSQPTTLDLISLVAETTKQSPTEPATRHSNDGAHHPLVHPRCSDDLMPRMKRIATRVRCVRFLLTQFVRSPTW